MIGYAKKSQILKKFDVDLIKNEDNFYSIKNFQSLIKYSNYTYNFKKSDCKN